MPNAVPKGAPIAVPESIAPVLVHRFRLWNEDEDHQPSFPGSSTWQAGYDARAMQILKPRPEAYGDWMVRPELSDAAIDAFDSAAESGASFSSALAEVFKVQSSAKAVPALYSTKGHPKTLAQLHAVQLAIEEWGRRLLRTRPDPYGTLGSQNWGVYAAHLGSGEYPRAKLEVARWTFARRLVGLSEAQSEALMDLDSVDPRLALTSSAARRASIANIIPGLPKMTRAIAPKTTPTRTGPARATVRATPREPIKPESTITTVFTVGLFAGLGGMIGYYGAKSIAGGAIGALAGAAVPFIVGAAVARLEPA